MLKALRTFIDVQGEVACHITGSCRRERTRLLVLSFTQLHKTISSPVRQGIAGVSLICSLICSKIALPGMIHPFSTSGYAWTTEMYKVHMNTCMISLQAPSGYLQGYAWTKETYKLHTPDPYYSVQLGSLEMASMASTCVAFTFYLFLPRGL